MIWQHASVRYLFSIFFLGSFNLQKCCNIYFLYNMRSNTLIISSALAFVKKVILFYTIVQLVDTRVHCCRASTVPVCREFSLLTSA